jgi:sugar phosphate isomerase/epimerase
MGSSGSVFKSDDVGVCLATLLPDPMVCDAADLARVANGAAEGGFRWVSFWVSHGSSIGLDASAAILADAGVRVRAVEGIVPWSSGPDAALRHADRALEMNVTLGADILLAAANPSTLDLAAAAEGFAALCGRAQDYGVRVVIEFIPFRTIGDLATTWQIVQRSGADNGGILLDMMHWQYQEGGPDLELLRTIPGAHLPYVQVCDAPARAPAEDYLSVAVSGRPLPGDGITDIASLLEGLIATGADPYFAFEVFNTEMAGDGPAAMAVNLRTAADRLFG